MKNKLRIFGTYIANEQAPKASVDSQSIIDQCSNCDGLSKAVVKEAELSTSPSDPVVHNMIGVHFHHATKQKKNIKGQHIDMTSNIYW